MDRHDEIASWASGFGVVDNIRQIGGRVWFDFERPGHRREQLWLPASDFDHQIRAADWGLIQTVGEGPPEPDWTRSVIRHALPPREWPDLAVHIDPEQRGVVVTIYRDADKGGPISAIRDRDEGWHSPSARPGPLRSRDDEVAAIPPMIEEFMELFYAAWQVKNASRYFMRY
jgi:hypothetical protein